MCGKRAGVWEFFFLQNMPCVSVSRNCAQPGGCAPFLPGWGGYMIHSFKLPPTQRDQKLDHDIDIDR